jgi:hypothetical protein
MGISFFIYAFLFTHTFSGTQLKCKRRAGCTLEGKLQHTRGKEVKSLAGYMSIYLRVTDV